MRVGSIAIVVVVLGGCGGGEDARDPGAAASTAPVNLRIGDLIPASGDPDHAPAQKAADLALRQIEDAIAKARADDRVTIEHRDDEPTADGAPAAARELVGGGATCLTGPWSSPATVAVAESVSIPGRILQISPAASADEISDLSDDGLVNRTALPDSAQGPALVRGIAADLGTASGRTVNIATSNDVYGVGVSKSFADAWQTEGGSLREEIVYDPDQADYASEAERLVSGDPDAVVIVDALGTFARLGPELASTGLYEPAIAWATEGVVGADGGGPAAAEAVDGMRATGSGAPSAAPSGAAFTRMFEAAKPANVKARPFAAQTFDAVILCYLAAVAAGSTDGAEMAAALPELTSPGGARYTWRQLPEAVRALRDGSDIDFHGASGPIDLDENGDPTAGSYLLYRYEDGSPEVIGDVSVDRSEE